MLDFDMPNMSGLNVIKKAKDKFRAKKLPMPRVILIVSSDEATNYQAVWG
jgi:CheY-like chemotaxis protein